MNPTRVNGILLIYHHHLRANAPTIMEHVEAFGRHSRFRVWAVNTELGFPSGLENLEFRIVVLHYSMFGWLPFYLDETFQSYIESCSSSHKIAFFQDEYRFWTQRVALIKRLKINQIYTLVEPEYFKDTYRRYVGEPKLTYTLTGYVSDRLVERGREFARPDEERTVDVGYRGRALPFHMGRGAQEKTAIAHRFREMAEGRGLVLDIATDEARRLYGRRWYRFLANCRGVLGVEAGVSIFDIEDVVRPEVERLQAADPAITFGQLSDRVLAKWEDNIPYRTISPRHFEAAALRVCQILFEGKYSGILVPMRHYLPLKKDFSNFEDVLRAFRDPAVRRELTENAYQDLIASGNYSYRRFLEGFDRDLVETGISPGLDPAVEATATAGLRRGALLRAVRGRLWTLYCTPFPGRDFVRAIARPAFRPLKARLAARRERNAR